MLLAIGTLIVVAYLILSINVYLESYALGQFSIGYGYLGPTEIRVILIARNTAIALGTASTSRRSTSTSPCSISPGSGSQR